MSESEAAPYEALTELIEHELELAGAGRFEELAEATIARIQLAGTLPHTPPASAREPLERADILQQRLKIEVLRGREAVLAALADVERAKRAARGYAPPRLRSHLSTSA
jgi:hypothetical protein